MRLLILLMLLVSCASQEPIPTPKPTPVQEVEPVKDPTGKKLTLWSTYYYSPAYKSTATGYDVLDHKGKAMGPKLPHKEICNLQLQGSGTIDGVMFGYHSKSSYKRVNCRSISSKISGTVKFQRDGSKYGVGVLNLHLTPFKSIAVDRRVIPYKSKLFIPALKGIEYEFDGKTHIHNGIVWAQDTGGAIKGNHIDFFIGPVAGGFKNTYPVARPFTKAFVKSKSSGTFTAYLLD